MVLNIGISIVNFLCENIQYTSLNLDNCMFMSKCEIYRNRQETIGNRGYSEFPFKNLNQKSITIHDLG